MAEPRHRQEAAARGGARAAGGGAAGGGQAAAGEGRVLEGPLETRGAGLVGKWEPRWFRLDGGTLDSFAAEDTFREQPLGSVALREIANLTWEGDRCRWQFEANGQTVRLRAKTEQEARSWFNCLQAGQISRPPAGGWAAPAAPAPAVEQEEADRPPHDLRGRCDAPAEAGQLDALVQIEKLLGLPRAPAPCQGSYYMVRARWEGRQGCSRTDERAGKPAADGSGEDCVVKQQLKLAGLPGAQHVIVSVFRRSSECMEDMKLVGICRLNVLDPEHTSVNTHELTAESGQPTGASVRLRLRPKPQANYVAPLDEASLLQADDASSSKSTILCQEGGANAQRFDLMPQAPRLPPPQAAAPAEEPPRPAEEPPGRERAKASPAGPASARGPKGRSQSPGRARSRSPGAKSRPRSLQRPRENQLRPPGPPAAALVEAYPTAVPLAVADPVGAGVPTFGRCDDLGDTFATSSTAPTPTQKWQDAGDTYTTASTPVTKSQDGTPRNQDNPKKPQGRLQDLYTMHEERERKMQLKREEQERAERQRIQEYREGLFKRTQKGLDPSRLNPQEAADRLFRDHAKRQAMQQYKQREFERQVRGARSRSSSFSTSQAREVSERLHGEHERREQEKQQKRSEREALELSSIQQAFVGAGTSYNARRHEELYEHARYRREMLEQKRKDFEAKELKKYADEAPVKQTGSVDYGRLEALYRDHKERKERQAVLTAQRQMREDEAIKEAAAASRPKTPPRRGRRGSTLLSMTLQCVCYKSLSADAELFARFRIAISEAVAREAGEPVAPEAVELAAGPAASSVSATVSLPNPGRLRPTSAAALADGVAARLAKVEGLTRISAGAGVSDISLTEEKAPPWPSCYRPAAKPEPQEPPTPPRRPAVELTTQADVLLAAVVSAVQMRCSYSLTLTAAELKELGTPLKAAFGVYKEALAICEKGEGFAQLCQRGSQRLFLEGALLPDDDGFRYCSEPDPIRQVEESIDDLLATAEAAQLALQGLVAPSGGLWVPGTVRPSPGGVPAALFAYNPGPKSEHAAKVKSFVRYQPGCGRKRAQHLLDLARLTVVFANCEMLQAALDHILENFEVVDVRNHFAAPQRLGNRCVEVYLVVNAQKDEEESMPHVCELRLEEFAFYRARDGAAPHLASFYERLRSCYACTSTNTDAILYLARSVLESPQEAHLVRQFRRHLARRFGSTVGGWRRALGGSRMVTYERFRDVCQALKCREHAPELWAELDMGKGGCISLFELDPDAVAALVKLRTRILMLLKSDDVDQETLFARLTSRVQLAQSGQLEVHEFRAVAKSFGLASIEADRLFSFLDYQGGNAHNPPASITVADIEWLRRLPNLVDTEAVVMASESKPTEIENARSCLAGVCASRRTRSICARTSVVHNASFELSSSRPTTPTRRRSSSLHRPRSSELHAARPQAQAQAPVVPEPAPPLEPAIPALAETLQAELDNAGGLDEVGFDETGLDETGLDEVGFDETGLDDPGLDDTGFDPDLDLGPRQSLLPEELEEETF